jgi:hypothetical protein
MELDLSNVQITKDCIKQISNIGSTTYQNICNGTNSVVPWGTLDWIVFVSVVLLLITLFYLFRKG